MDRSTSLIVKTRLQMIELHQSGKLTAEEISRTFGWSQKTLYKWKGRYREEGLQGLANRTSRPHRSPRLCTPDLENEVIEARKNLPKGPSYLAHLPELKGKISPHGIYQVLCRHGFNRLRVKSGIKALLYQKEKPWQMVHMDIKYLPAIQGQKGREYQFTAIDDCTREAYAAIFPSKHTKHAVRFLLEVAQWANVPIGTVLTDNGKEFVSGLFNRACNGLGIKHKRTRPRRPQTNGKVERFHRTVDEECYSLRFSSTEERKSALNAYLRFYNEQRLHSSLGYRTPRETMLKLGGRRA